MRFACLTRRAPCDTIVLFSHNYERQSALQVKCNGSELVNSLSDRPDDRTSGDALPLTTNRGQLIDADVSESVDSEPKKEDLQRIIALMDGFKASKVRSKCQLLTFINA